MNSFTIRTMRRDEISLAIDWAAAEGWNPGIADAACFASVDPEGFLIAELDGAPAATVSCVNYDARFAFLGFYIVRAELRGRGYGLRIWNAAIAHAGARVIGLDGVTAQQENYRKSGFQAGLRQCSLWRHRCGARRAARRHHCPARRPVRGGGGRRRHRVSGAAIRVPAGLDRRGRTYRLRVDAQWPACRLGRDPSMPERFQDRPACGRRPRQRRSGAFRFDCRVGGGEIFLDVPGVNRDAVALAQDFGLAPVFETARMYTGAIPPLRLQRVFGVTSFELG